MRQTKDSKFQTVTVMVNLIDHWSYAEPWHIDWYIGQYDGCYSIDTWLIFNWYSTESQPKSRLMLGRYNDWYCMCIGRCSGRYTNILLTLHLYITDTLPSISVDISIDILYDIILLYNILTDISFSFLCFWPMLFQSGTIISVEYWIFYRVSIG